MQHVAHDADPQALDTAEVIADRQQVQKPLRGVLVAASPALIEITNDASAAGDRGPRLVSPGHGIIGMRERVAVLGGDLLPPRVPAAAPGRRAAPVRLQRVMIRVIVADDQALVRADSGC